jgi:hypothetical protein
MRISLYSISKEWLQILSLHIRDDNHHHVYSFLVAAMTNYHKLGGLKQQKCILSSREDRSLHWSWALGHAPS